MVILSCTCDRSVLSCQYQGQIRTVCIGTALYSMSVCVPGATARGDCELVLVDEARPNRHLQVICSKREQLTEVLILQTKVNPS